MNKTVTANIGGMVFHIEEQAYEKLNKYLSAIKSHFTTSDGRDEIIQDIEGRIAEIFQQRNASKEVILSPDVDYVIDVMGKPEQLFGEDGPAASTAESATVHTKSYRRLYRDEDDHVIGGVCSGLSHRLDIDPVWLRLLFVVILFAGGSGILIYIILWIVLPKAETPAQKVEMRGEPVNVSTISKEAASTQPAKPESALSRIFGLLGSVILMVLKFFAYAAGAFVAFIGLIILFALVVALLAVLGVGGITIPIFISDYFLSPTQQFWSMIALFLVIGIPIIMLVYAAVKMLFKVKYSNRLLNMSALALWITGIIIALLVGTNIGREFGYEEKIRTSVPLVSPGTDTMFVKLMDNAQYNDEDNSIHVGFFSGSNNSYTTGKDFVINEDNVRFDVQKAAGDKFELTQILSARGRSKQDAVKNAQSIVYNFEQKDSMLMFSEYFPLPKGVKFRDQTVKMILKIPVGKTFYMDESIEDIIYDIKNVTDTWDGNMGGHYWMMTEAGLKCTDYNFENDPEANIGNQHKKDVDIQINENGIHINGLDDSIKKDIEKGDVKVHIDEHGVHIKASENKK